MDKIEQSVTQPSITQALDDQGKFDIKTKQEVKDILILETNADKDVKLNSMRLLPEPKGSTNQKDLMNCANREEDISSSIWSFMMMLAEIELELKQSSRNDAYYQRNSALEESKRAAEFVKKAAKFMMASSIVSGVLSSTGGLIGLKSVAQVKMPNMPKFSDIKSKLESIPIPGRSGKYSPIKAEKKQGIVNDPTTSQGGNIRSTLRESELSKIDQNDLMGLLRESVKESANKNKTNKNTELNNSNRNSMQTSTQGVETKNNTLKDPKVDNFDKLEMDKNKLSARKLSDMSRSSSMLFDSSGRIVGGVIQSQAELQRAEQIRVEALASLAQSMGGQNEQYVNSMADSINKIYANVNQILESFNSMFRQASRV